MKKRRWQMLDDYATLQMKPFFARKAIYHNPTNCPYFLSNLWSKSPHKKAHSRKKSIGLPGTKERFWRPEKIVFNFKRSILSAKNHFC